MSTKKNQSEHLFVLAGKRLSRIVPWAAVFAVAMVIITVVLQTVGFAPQMKIV